MPDSATDIISQTRLLPENRDDDSARTVPLSILDHTVVKFAPASAVWYFDRSNSDAYNPTTLLRSLQKTVNWYPQWAGQLHWLPYDLTKRSPHGRVGLTYGSPADPGIEVVVVCCSHTLASLVPSSQVRVAGGIWNAAQTPSNELLCPTSLALYSSDKPSGLPCVSAQITTFACGSTGIGLRMVHCIADAIAMCQFVKDWAAVHTAMRATLPCPNLSPVFDPALLDRCAGEPASTGSEPDVTLVSPSRSLPVLRYDWWASADGCPVFMLPSTKVPPALTVRGAEVDLGPPGDRMPWSEWDVHAPVSHHLVYFTSAEIDRMRDDASPPSSGPAPHISRLDALLAFIWRLVVRARGMQNDRDPMHMAVTIGVRSRVSPPLPDAFLGSPITLARVTLTGAEIASDPSSAGGGAGTLAAPASAIRAAVAQFTPSAVAALLHEKAHEVNPQRIWHAFLGRRHSIVTSWQNLDVYGVDFGGGAPPRYVDAVMPSMDGCIHVMEAGPAGATSQTGAAKRWYDEPVCVSLHLADDVMEKLLNDPELRRYRLDDVL